MEEQLISFETAKLAELQGYNIASEMCWIETTSPLFKSPFYTQRNKVGYITEGCNYINQPTQSLLQKWIREIHKIDVMIYCNASGWMWELNKAASPDWFSGGTFINWSAYKGPNSTGEWDIYEDALEAGLIAALNRLNS